MKKILLLSDLHVGSIWGLWPQGFETKDRRTGDTLTFILTETQEKLWESWLEMCQKQKDIECIILNGDLCDGQQRKSRGRGTVTTNMQIQTDAAISALSYLPDVPLYFTQGTEYHELADGAPVEESIARYFSAEFGDDLIIEECGIRIHAGHTIPTSMSSWQYWTTAIARDLLLLALHDAEEKYGKVDVAIRSHRHNFCAAIFRSQVGIITPCWQVRTPYAAMKDIVSPPDIGYVVLHVDGKNIMIDRSGIQPSPVRPCRVVGRDRK